jgi:hypothetical protein
MIRRQMLPSMIFAFSFRTFPDMTLPVTPLGYSPLKKNQTMMSNAFTMILSLTILFLHVYTAQESSSSLRFMGPARLRGQRNLPAQLTSLVTHSNR